MCIQKAGELCPEGYQVEGSGATNSAGFFSNGYSSTFFAVSRPQLFVECTAPTTAVVPTSAAEDDPTRLVNCRIDGKLDMMLRGACVKKGGEPLE
jgi:hypothetical protein